MTLKIRKLPQREDVYDITVEDNHNFFANGILVHNCVEITLPTKPLNSIDDGATMKRVRVHKDKVDEFNEYMENHNDILYENTDSYEVVDANDHDSEYQYFDSKIADKNGAEISICSLSAINLGKFSKPSEMEKPCELAVRALDEMLDFQRYPVLAAEISTMRRRPIGIGIINLAYWMARNDMTYSRPKLRMIDEWMEAWSYYLISASAKLAEEKGACLASDQTKYSEGIVPMDTRAPAVDELIRYDERMPWNDLRERLKKHGIRNSTLMACMPSETSAQISNATNGIEPPRAIVSVKQSKHGVLRQVVPGATSGIKNKYELLWDQKSPRGYLKVCAIIQKYCDQSISANTSYSSLHYKDGKIPMSTMLQDLLYSYKYGLKTLYYFNTHDGAGEVDDKDLEELSEQDECESCKI